MKITIDRFEGDFAVVELPDGRFCNIPKIILENGCEGDVFNIEKDVDETSKRKSDIEALMDELFE